MKGIKDAHRIVVKVGTSTLTYDTGKVNLRRMDKLAQVISDLRNSGTEVALVTSAAIAVGVGKLGLSERPGDIPSRQAVATVGQCELMFMYDKLFSEYGNTIGQLLITRSDFENGERRANLSNSFEKLFEFGAIPVINENDSIAVEEIVFGDNDTLSAMVAKLINADALIILSDIAGLYSGNPREDESAYLIPVVEELPAARETVAARLSYPEERITCATASEIAGQTFDALNVKLIEFAGSAGSPAGSSAASEAPADASSPAAASSAADPAGESRAASSRWPYASSGIPDELFIRGDVPMTKQEVRAVALAKLRLTATDTVWDVGAGTGSVSIEAALVARAGSVWAVERNAAGVRLIRENADAFGCGNVLAVPGVAPEVLSKLPAPDAVFVGGSAGELPFIVEAALEKSSQVRLCVPCVTVEPLTEACALLSGSRFKGFEACQVSAARAEAVGSHHLMKAQNPVFLVSARGAGGEGGAR